MPNIDWLKVGLGCVIALILAVAVWYVTEPMRAAKANKAAAAHVTATLAEAKPKEAAKAAKANEQTSNTIAATEDRSRARASRVVGSPDPDRAFFDGVCDGELYKADPQCGGGGGKKRGGGRSG